MTGVDRVGAFTGLLDGPWSAGYDEPDLSPQARPIVVPERRRAWLRSRRY